MPYFGQEPPGLVPEVFAPGVVSQLGRHEGAVSFLPTLGEVYFNANNKDGEAHIYFSKFEEDQWTPVETLDLTGGQIEEQMHPSVTPDGKRLYFAAISSDLTYNKIWYADRLNGSWGSAKMLDSPINEGQVFFPNQSTNGDLYYFNLSSFQNYRASDEANGFAEFEPVGLEFGVHAFMAPSLDYIVMNARNQEDQDRNDNDIYVSFRAIDGTWDRPINLGTDINSTASERAPTISPDGKFLFFGKDELGGAGDADIYWVSTQVIDNLRPVVN
ncbi:MAG: hypothetical protein ABJ205_08705 [Erythrobacter sp.]|uniref:hypothetical protein n=1 Tax=Erythrobacter sp. TaxID=1042 RepID=UPI0032652694